jgi:hypothetical protein
MVIVVVVVIVVERLERRNEPCLTAESQKESKILDKNTIHLS